ncbi:MAG: glycosyltransferase family 39 protein [Candidatus Levybacteria bacterium]|nr:glycosyltransferase family 39 protein [Candidatus Levybacteria bacterium]
MKAKSKEEVTSKRKRFYLSKWSIALIAIVIVGAVLRFWNFPHGYTFDGDATRDAIIAYEGARTGYFPLVGAFSSTGPYTFGPWYYVSLIAAAFVAPTPYTPWILMGLTSIMTVIVMYDIGRLVSSKKLGLLLALLTALAPSQIAVSTSLSNIAPVAFFATLSLWAAVRIIKTLRPKMYWYLIFGVCIGLAINAHYQSIGLLVMPIAVWFLSKEKRYQNALLFVLGVLVTFIPLLLFNFTNDWHTVRGMYAYYLSRDQFYVANSWSIYVFAFLPSLITNIFGTSQMISMIMLISLPLLFSFYIFKKKIPANVFVPTIVLLVNFISLRYYGGERLFPYHYFLEPLILFIVGFSLYKLLSIKRYGIVLFLIATLPVIVSMGNYDINRQRILAQDHDRIPSEAKTLLQKYPDNRLVFYKCNGDPSPKAEAIQYLLQFESLSEKGSVQKLGLETGICKYPTTPRNDFTITSTRELQESIYPPVKGTSVADFTNATDAALKDALWQEVTTKKLFIKATQWY